MKETSKLTQGIIHKHKYTYTVKHRGLYHGAPTGKPCRTAALKVLVAVGGHALCIVHAGAGGARVHLCLAVLAREWQLAVALVVAHLVRAISMHARVAGTLVDVRLAHLTCTHAS